MSFKLMQGVKDLFYVSNKATKDILENVNRC